MLVAFLALAFLLEPAPVAERGGLPPARHATCVRFYSLESDTKPEALNQTVRGFSAGGVEARIVLGPVKISSRPKERFLALELPCALTPKSVETALKKVSPRAEELLWTAFQGPDRTLPTILSYSALECVVGMDDDLRYFELEKGCARFFYAPGKLDAEKLRSKFRKLYEPFQAGDLGELVHETIEWKLAGKIEPAAADTLQKAIAKVPGVRKARVDAARGTLSVEIDDAGLRAAAALRADASQGLPPTGFLQDEILNALDAAKIGVAAESR